MLEFIEKIPDSLLQVLTNTSRADQEDSMCFKMLQSGVKVSLDSGELQYGQDNDNGDVEEEKLFKRVSTDIAEQTGTLYLTSDSMIWYNESAKFGFSFDYQAIVLHALIESSPSTWDVFMQIEAGKLVLPDATELTEEDYDPEDGQDDCLTWDVTMSVGLREIAEKVFKYITTSSASEMVLEDSEKDLTGNNNDE